METYTYMIFDDGGFFVVVTDIDGTCGVIAPVGGIDERGIIVESGTWESIPWFRPNGSELLVQASIVEI